MEQVKLTRTAACEIVQLDSNIPISARLITRKRFRNVSSHWHESLEINFYLEGEIVFSIDGKARQYGPGRVCIINSEAVHHSEVVQDFAVKDDKVIGLTLLVGYDFIKSLIPDIHDIFFSIDTQEAEIRIENCLLELLKERVEETYPYNNLRMLGTVCDLLLILCQLCRHSKEIIAVNTQRDVERIRYILDYLQEHYTEELAQNELAEKFHFSREYFSRFFKRYTGMSPRDYVTQYRLLQAIRQIEETDSTMLDIALANGFGNERRFINSFRKFYQMTPGQYKKQSQKEKKEQAQVTKPQ